LTDDDSKATGDTLIIKINDNTVYNKTGSVIPYSLSGFKAKTGDKLYIRYNPGKVLYPHYDSNTKQWEDYIYEQCDLEVTFTGGYYNPHYSKGGRGIVVIEERIQEYEFN
jgi:hypothetical protein